MIGDTVAGCWALSDVVTGLLGGVVDVGHDAALPYLAQVITRNSHQGAATVVLHVGQSMHRWLLDVSERPQGLAVLLSRSAGSQVQARLEITVERRAEYRP